MSSRTFLRGPLRAAGIVAALIVIAVADAAYAQARGGGRGGPPPTAKQAAAIDLTGYWVSVSTEDWKFRMVTPRKGVYELLQLNAEGRKVADSWDPAKDEAAGEQCRGYGAGNIMRLPTRLRVSWQDDTTLKIETDAGTQTRVLRFGPSTPAGEPTWQGHSVAEWEFGPGRGANRGGNLKVVTTNLRAGYVRKNGAPYSDKTTITEYFDVHSTPNGDRWLTVATKLEDPVYGSRPYYTSSDFKKLPDATGWNPTPCVAK